MSTVYPSQRFALRSLLRTGKPIPHPALAEVERIAMRDLDDGRSAAHALRHGRYVRRELTHTANTGPEAA